MFIVFIVSDNCKKQKTIFAIIKISNTQSIQINETKYAVFLFYIQWIHAIKKIFVFR